MENYSIDLSAGLKTIELKFSDVGESTFIKFNPADLDLSRRAFEAKDMINNAVEEFSKIEFDDSEEAETRMAEEMGKVEDAIYKAVDYAFGNKISGEVFKFCSPLAIVNGEYYFVHFMDAIAPVINKIKTEQEKKADKKAEKYTEKYAKQKAEFLAKKNGAKK